uniref:C2 domain containing 3 centriole elongation regulator n=1 Tax=Scophthalmus maximus TaxID=52904 RepID=A0A8D2ZTY0_SCOMX
MKGRKQRAVKAGSGKRKVPGDVSPSTSLPPLVEGQLRCFLRLTISRILWTVHKPPSSTFVRLRWWGESSNGTHFFPRDGSQLSQKTIKTTTRFAIRCGPKQFTSYLTDMGSLVLEVQTNPDHLPIARALVAGISSLSMSHPISGFYTLVSPTSEKLGELQVRKKKKFTCQHANSFCGIAPARHRGNKLRNAMVLSALTCDMDSAPALKDTPLPLPKDNILPPFKLVLNTSPLPLWDGDVFSPDTLSGHSSVCGDSELNDPQYDTSLLENLFYKTPVSRTFSDDCQAVSMSVYQGFFRVFLVLRQMSDTRPDDTEPVGQGPPATYPLSRFIFSTYFVEYTFPMVSTSGSKAGHGEVTRAVSSKVTGGVVKFLQRSAFPVRFGTAAVKQLCQIDLIFKIYSRRSDQKKVSNASPSQVAPSPQRESGSRVQLVQTGRDDFPSHSLEDSRLNVWSPPKPFKEPSPHPDLTSPYKTWQQADEDPKVLLHTLLMVPDGKNFSLGPLQAPNVYLNCKLFWCDEMARSVVSWGQANPSFNFAQVTPVALTTKLLERMKNNVMVIEVWQKMGSSGQDRLLGLVKLPLHQFYMSFRDEKITHLLLQAQYPVLGVDSYMPVIDVFSGSCKGNLRVLLAMGGSEQIIALQRTRDEEYDNLPHLMKPVNLLDHQPHSQKKAMAAQEDAMKEHLFVIRVEKVNGLMPLQSTVWGEADCYVQYSFPCQDGVNLKPFRTTTTLCLPDPAFGHTETHVLLVPDGVPVQRLLLSSLSSQGLCSGGGVQFEVWCRYYYPNVRDQLVAKGLLPLSKLCAMVTMQRQHPNEAQMFSLPLVPRTDSPTGHQPQPSGQLDVCIRYKHRPVRPEGQTGRGAASRVVTLVVQVHRGSGLQAAARALSEQDERFSYFAGVGVNTYVTIQLSVLPESDRRCTRTVARTFCPEFDHYTEMSCDLLVQRSGGETFSLAEQLEEASAVFNVWNRDNRKALNIAKPKDVMLGTVKIPLADLIYKRTGTLNSVETAVLNTRSSMSWSGGLELSVNFAHHSDRDRVIKAAQGLGWVMAPSDCEMQDDDEEAWQEKVNKLSLTFSMPRAWMPVHCLLLPGHSDLQRSTYCYFRYKFYDQEAFCSQMKHPSVVEGGEDRQSTVSFEGSRTLELRRTQPLLWYLREERLELQVWVAFKKDKTRRPTDTDRLVGSAFVDLSSLAKTSEQKLTLSGVYPLFRRSAADLQGAALRVHIAMTAASVTREQSAGADTQVDSDSRGELLSDEVEMADRPTSPSTPKKCTRKIKSPRTTPDITSVQHTEMSLHESFPVTVTVDRAMHLNLKGCPLAERSEGTPCCCVSYVTADSAEPVSTAVIADTDCPVWDHQHECRLSKQLLVDPQQSLVFKVWHKGEMERVLGFASVDLSPLLCGFHSVCGWYNITDFSGQCHGQLKVAVTPLRGVRDLRGQRKTVNDEAAKNSTVRENHSYVQNIFQNRIDKKCFIIKESNESDSHFEHMDKVRLYHQSLQEQTAAHSVCSSSAGDISPSSSFLFSALRKKLSELDNIQRYFSSKLTTATFPSVSEQNCRNQPEEQRASKTDTSRLLVKSNQLVGEVNNIISDNNPQTISSLRRASNSSQEDASTLPLPKMSEDQTPDSEAEEEKDRRHYDVTVSEDEKEERTGDNDDYEEFVVKPRHLNEVTSLTDKTSPWTSIHSDPDVVSLESPEAPEEPDLSQDEDDMEQMVNLEAHESIGKHEHATGEANDSFCQSSEDISDTEGDDERTLHAPDERQTKESNGPNKESFDTGPPPTVQHATDTPGVSLDDQHSHSVPVGVPNFFLPSHQLEASMRTIRLAPCFSQSSSDPVSSCHQLHVWHSHCFFPSLQPFH